MTGLPTRIFPKLRALGTGTLLATGGFIGGNVLYFVAVVLLLQTGLLSSVDSPMAGVVSLFVLQGIAFPLTVFLYAKHTERDLSFFNIKSLTTHTLKYGVGGFGALLAVQITLGALAIASGTPTAESTATQAPPIYLVTYAILSVLIVGPMEELLFRGAIQGRLRETYSAPAAIVLTGALFSVPHWSALVTGGGRVQTIVMLFILGCTLGLIYERSENLTSTMIAHGLFNAFVFSVNALPTG